MWVEGGEADGVTLYYAVFGILVLSFVVTAGGGAYRPYLIWAIQSCMTNHIIKLSAPEVLKIFKEFLLMSVSLNVQNLFCLALFLCTASLICGVFKKVSFAIFFAIHSYSLGN